MHEWVWLGWVDWTCKRCGCTFHGSDTWGCGRSQDELRAAAPSPQAKLHQYGMTGDFVERTCDEWIAHRKEVPDAPSQAPPVH